MSIRQLGTVAGLVAALVVTSLCLLAAGTPIANAADGNQSAAPAALARPGVSATLLRDWSPLSPLATVSVGAHASGARPVITKLSLSAAKPGARPVTRDGEVVETQRLETIADLCALDLTPDFLR